MEKLKTKCKNEIRSFFGLTLVNLVIAALIMALGIGLGVTQLLALVELGTIQLLPLLLISAGFIAVIAGVYWLIKTAEILDGVENINSAWEQISQHDNQDQITDVIIEMIAHYRKNQPIIDTMTILGRIGGFLFLVAGSLSLVYAVNILLTSDVFLEGISQLAGGIMAFGVGIGSLLIAKYFKRYSGVWVSRLQEEHSIQEALKKAKLAERNGLDTDFET